MSDQVQNEKFEVHNENLRDGHLTGIEAVSPSAQNTAFQLYKKGNIVEIVGAGGAVKLPPAKIGEVVSIVNDGANALDVYPFLGDDCGSGVNTAISLAVGESAMFESLEDGIFKKTYSSVSSALIGSLYAEIFGVDGDYAATVGLGTAVPFPNAGPLTSGFETTSNSIKVLADGDYLVEVDISSIDEPGQLVIAKNNIETNIASGRATGTSPITISKIMTLVSNDILKVFNPAGNASALTVTPIAGGTIAVMQTFKLTKLN